MLGGERLPREELVAAFVAACGIRGDEAEAWLDARTDIACRPAPSDATPTRATPADATPVDATPVDIAPAGAAPARARAWLRRWTCIGAPALVTPLRGGATASGVFNDDEEVGRGAWARC